MFTALRKWLRTLGEAMSESSSRQRGQYDVNKQNDLARRNQYLNLSDAEYRKRFHPNDNVVDAEPFDPYSRKGFRR